MMLARNARGQGLSGYGQGEVKGGTRVSLRCFVRAVDITYIDFGPRDASTCVYCFKKSREIV